MLPFFYRTSDTLYLAPSADLYPFNNTGKPRVPSTNLNTWNGPIVGQ